MRNPETIQALPGQAEAGGPAVAAQRTPSWGSKELNILRHAIGYDDAGNDRWHGAAADERRNRFITSADGPDGVVCRALCSAGLMKDYGPQVLAGGMHFYEVTESVRALVLANRPAPKKLTRSQERWRRYRLSADCFENFRSFLRYESRVKERGVS